MIYALFFYRAKITWRRIILAKLLTNIQNVLLGASGAPFCTARATSTT